MSPNLWSQNTPEKFWLCEPDMQAELWEKAIAQSINVLELSEAPKSIDHLSRFKKASRGRT